MKKPVYTLVAAAFLAAASLTFVGCTKTNDQAGTGQNQEAAGAAKPYTLDTCVVSGEKLGSMGTPVTFVHEGQEVKLCCKNCRPDFDKDPAKFMKKIAEGKKS